MQNPGSVSLLRDCIPDSAGTHSSIRDRFPKFGLPTLASLPAGHSLREALSVLIDAAGKGEIFQIPDREGPLTADFCFSVMFQGPEQWAEILADGSVGERIVYASERVRKRRRPARGGDLHQERGISFATIRTLGSLISGSDVTRQVAAHRRGHYTGSVINTSPRR